MSLLADVAKGKVLVHAPTLEQHRNATLIARDVYAGPRTAAVRLHGLNDLLIRCKPPRGSEFARCPFLAVWCEFVNDDGGYPSAFAVTELPVDSWSFEAVDGLATVLAVSGYISRGAEAAFMGTALVPMDRHGCSLGQPIAFPFTQPPGRPEADVLIQWATCALGVLSLINCRNIELRPAKAAAGDGRSAGVRGDGWKTLCIKVPGAFSAPSGGQEWSELTELTREHLVRGHFRTYTSDAPLFGKLVGRFWVAPHLRGDHERGFLGKDYLVSPANQELAS